MALDLFNNHELLELAIVFGKVIFLLVLLLQIPPLMIWLERRAPALMQRRRGPNRVGLFKWRIWGLLQSLADAVKLIFKEEISPAGAHKALFQLAPLLGVIPAFAIVAVIPFGQTITLANGMTIPLSLAQLDIGFLFILALSSLGVYSVAVAGWASNSKYSLLGSLRASAQMISYEIPLGLSLIPIVLIYGTLDLNSIVEAQGQVWGIVKAPLSFVIFLVCMFAETNRAPFDMAEGESELVAGFHTEYGSTKFAAFFLSEYIVMFVLSCLAATLFFGGWQIPFISHTFLVSTFGTAVAALLGFGSLVLKAAFFMWLYVWVRWSLPRFRYDRLMALGWKFLLPLGLFNILLTSVILGSY